MQSESKCELLLRARGIVTSREAVDALGVNQSTVSRAMNALGSRRILRIGKARAARYGLRRSVRGQNSEWPVYCIDSDASAALVGRLYSLERGYWVFEQQNAWDTLRGREFRDGLYPGLPWFMHDLRPKGFLGRCFAHCHAAELGLPRDPRLWSDDDALMGLLKVGADLPGAFVIGEAMLAVVQNRMLHSSLPEDDRTTAYPRLANAVLADEMPGSSAAGEQPKFTACVRNSGGDVRHVIVKFSGAAGRPEDRRWADLLVAEHIVNRILDESGIPCASTAVFSAGDRTFLESQRFDRVGEFGRRGLVTLEAQDAAFYGEITTPWTMAADRLRSDGWLCAEDADRLSLLWWFGTLIGNTDMHYGNISLFLEPNRPLQLAPVYDMVPMLYRPGIEGQFRNQPLVPTPPAPETIPIWSRSASLAMHFWSELAEEPMASAAFRSIATQNAETLLALKDRFC
ncbi:MAG: type II toxin-antitoxin system HipA family toxin YjjJ [Kiritimatiellia bacterium]|jgi:hypothetical protein|nr:type II toxin-antitoxin system HipA family toxin YjjJ [Kiritimatiellia bacterium]